MEDANLPENDEIRIIIKDHWASVIEKYNLKKVWEKVSECKNHTPYVRYKSGEFFIEIGIYPVCTLTGWYNRETEWMEWPYWEQIEKFKGWEKQVPGVIAFIQEYQKETGIL